VKRIILFTLLLMLSNPAGAVLTFYTDEAAYLTDVTAVGYRIITEGFEDDLVWGTVRTGISDPNYGPVIISQGITWTSNHPENQITTGNGPALNGFWGFYSIPHGNYSTGTGCDVPGVCGDGFLGTRLDTIYAIGGWITGMYGGRLKLVLDGDTLNAVNFDGQNATTNAHQFFGVIETNGFISFEFREWEGTAEDQKFIWADDFTIGLPLSSAVMITSFHAVARGLNVDIAWQISTDESLSGFRIYREDAGGKVSRFPGAGLLDLETTKFTDSDVLPGAEYKYTLAVVKPDGREVRSIETKVGIEIAPAHLSQNYPNPFNPGTRIGYYVDRESDVSLRIYDVTGRHVRTLTESRQSPGEYTELWDGTDEQGDPVASGTYFYRLRIGKTTLTRKMVLLK
jgi:hypothetical protein